MGQPLLHKHILKAYKLSFYKNKWMHKEFLFAILNKKHRITGTMETGPLSAHYFMKLKCETV